MKTKTILLFLLSLLLSQTAAAQSVNIHKTDGTILAIPISEIDYIDFTASSIPEEPQAYTTCPDANHPHMIDLGLPSGTKWACCNVGASTPEGYGDRSFGESVRPVR